MKEKKDLSRVPTTLDQILSSDGEGRTANEVLGVLVDAHVKEAKAIMGRTQLLNQWQAGVVTRALHRARRGLGGNLARPMPFVSEYVLDLLTLFNSVKGKGREQFVSAWRDSQVERRRQEEMREKERQRVLGG